MPEQDLVPEAIERLAGLEPFSAVFICHQNLHLSQRLAEMARSFDCLSKEAPLLMVGPVPASTTDKLSKISSTTNSIEHYDIYTATCSVEAIVQEPLDRLAQAIHHQLCESSNFDRNDPRLESWERLRADVKEHFRAQADHLTVKLRTIGCTLKSVQDAAKAYIMSDDDISTLARLEFRRRVVESMFSVSHAAGFLDTLRNVESEMLTWAYLSQPEKEELVRQIRSIPEILASVGMKIIRL